LDKDNNGFLNHEAFTRIPELHVNPMRDRIIEVLIVDYGHDGKLNFKQFAKGLSVFRRSKEPSDKELKLKFLFRVNIDLVVETLVA
jgi:Ca2+-binding EF-hand superfamily protein